MTKDFSGQNLRGRSFKGQNLEGANFSYADIRGTDFTGANLEGTNFRNAKAGLQYHWVIFLLLASCILATVSGMIFGVASSWAVTLLSPVFTKQFTSSPPKQLYRVRQSGISAPSFCVHPWF